MNLFTQMWAFLIVDSTIPHNMEISFTKFFPSGPPWWCHVTFLCWFFQSYTGSSTSPPLWVPDRFSRKNCTSWMSVEEQMWNQRNQVRAAKMWWMQRSLVLWRKEYKRLWNLVKIPLITGSLTLHFGIIVCVRVCAYARVGTYVSLPSSLSLSGSLSESLFLSHTFPSSCSPIPFRLLPSPNLSFQVAERRRADKTTVPVQGPEWCHLSESLSGDNNKWYLPKSY